MRRSWIWLSIVLSALALGATEIHSLAAGVSRGQQTTSARHDASEASAARDALDTLVRDKEYPELERRFGSSAQLPPAERDYFAGVLANRKNRLQESIALLEKTLPLLKDRHRIESGMETLADDYQKLFRYADWAQVLSDIREHYADQLDVTAKKQVNDDFQLAELLKNAPPQTVKFDGSQTVTIRRSRFGLLEVAVTIGERVEWWIFDTGASTTTISMSTAKRLGLELSRGSATTQGATGADLALRIAIIPQLLLGKAELRNVAALVLEDSSLAISVGEDKPYQIEGILGFPAMAAFDAITFFGDDRMVIGGEALPGAISFPMYLDENAPRFAAKVAGRDVVFSLDSGAAMSQFSEKYYKAFRNVFADGEKASFSFSGAGGTKETHVYRQKTVELGGDGGSVRLEDVAVMTEPTGNHDIDSHYGNVGQDLLKKVRNFTLDFQHMRLLTSPAK